MAALGRGAGVAALALLGIALMAALITRQEARPAVLAGNVSPGAWHAIRKLVDDYSMECKCDAGKKCDCAANAANDVRVALRNAVERQFAPPNMYYRTKDGYAYRLRGFQKPKPPVHIDRPSPDPVTVYKRPSAPAAPKPKVMAKPKVKPVLNGLPPIPVSARFVKPADPVVFFRTHASWKPSASTARSASLLHQRFKAATARTSKLYELPMLAAPRAEAQKETEGEDPLYDSEWFRDWMDYSKLILSDGVLEEAEQQSQLPERPNSAIELPYQLGQEADFADWDYAFSDDAVVPFRVVDGTDFNYPDLDANDGYAGAVLLDYGGESPDQEAYANYLAQQAAAPPPDPTSADGWLRDDPAY